MSKKSDAPPAEGMQRIHWHIATDKVGSECTGYFDIESDATDDEIEEQAKEAAFERLEWNWLREGKV